jgi:uncharacterized membrane protein YjfL (UPF0719 family)
MGELLRHLFDHIPFYVYALLMVLAAKVLYQRTSGIAFVDELTERDNPAFGACLAGYLIGVAIAMTGAFPSNSTSFEDGAITMTYSGLLGIILMRASIEINHRFILNKFNVDFEMIKDRNLGAGIGVAGSSIGTGLVLAAALTGDSDGYLNAIRDIVVYWAAGQALFIIGAAVFYHTAGYDVEKTMEHDNNTAAGLSLGGFLVALGIVLGAALQNASSNLAEELAHTGILIVVCGPLLLLTTVITQKLILPRINLAKEIAIDRNCAAGLICAAASISTALLLAALITNH